MKNSLKISGRVLLFPTPTEVSIIHLEVLDEHCS
jgi:hypothetical protein